MKYMHTFRKNGRGESKGGFNVTAFNMSLNFNRKVEMKK